MLVEVKLRKTSSYLNYESLRIDRYQEFWNDAILVFIVSFSDVFYAQRVSELEHKNEEISSIGDTSYDVNTDFLKFEEIFTRVNKEDLCYYKQKALDLFEN